MKKKIYIDIDGVIGDFVAAIFRFFPDAKLQNPYVYQIDQMFSNVENEIALQKMLYGTNNFKLYPFVGEVLRRLENLDFELEFLSARDDTLRENSFRTLEQLELSNTWYFYHDLYPVQTKITHIKDDIILSKIDRAWVIEDNPAFMVSMAQFYKRNFEFKKILSTLRYMQPYNQSEQLLTEFLPDFIEVMNWPHILSEILK